MHHSRMCPFLERGDDRCAERINLECLIEAFRFCAGDYERCATYHEIRLERIAGQQRERKARSA